MTLSAPGHSTLSRRAVALPVIQPAPVPLGPLHVLIDSAGLQVYGAGRWLEVKHAAKSRRTWRKRHLAVDAANGAIMVQTLTDQEADDPSPVGPPLDQIDDPIAQGTADGAYQGTTVLVFSAQERGNRSKTDNRCSLVYQATLDLRETRFYETIFRAK